MVVLLKPCVVVLSGMPLMGKSALAGELVKMTNLVHVDVDELRQLLFPNPQRLLFKSETEFALMESCYELLTKNAEWEAEHLRMAGWVTGKGSWEEIKKAVEKDVGHPYSWFSGLSFKFLPRKHTFNTHRHSQMFNYPFGILRQKLIATFHESEFRFRLKQEPLWIRKQ